MIRRLLTLMAIASLAADAPDSTGSAQGRGYAIRWHAGTKPGASSIEVSGLDTANLDALARTDWQGERWAALISVTIVSDRDQAQREAPAILGSYRVDGRVVRFEPRFAWEPGLVHQVRFRPSRLPLPVAGAPADMTARFRPPLPEPEAPARVVRVDPSADRLPENLLKFYIHFSRPMSRGEVYQRVRLLDASGRKLELPFLELGEELWDPSGTRVTLLLDPGRIKRGLKPREEQGPVLESGRAYVLVVDRSWPDAQGQPLRSTYRKPFRAGPEDDSQPDPKTWKFESPRAGRESPLTVEFPEPLDHAMLERVVHVRDSEGRVIDGRVEVGTAGTRWAFYPDHPWKTGSYQLVADSTLEDLAGNSIARPFEVDVLRPVARRVEAETVSIGFKVEDEGSP